MRQWYSKLPQSINSYSWEECETTIRNVYEKGGYGVGCYSEYIEGLCPGKDKCPLFALKEEQKVYDADTETKINAELQKILNADNQLEALTPHLDNMLVGEETTKKAITVLCLSAKCKEPEKKQIILLKGEPGGGKSNLAKHTTKGYIIKDVGRFTAHALDYTDLGSFEILYLKELGNMDDEANGVSTFKFVSSEDGGYIVEGTVKDEETGKFKTEQRKIPPITTISTTNRIFLDSQLDRRSWTFGIDETMKQTEKIRDWFAKETIQKAEKLLGKRALTDSELSSEIFSRFIRQFKQTQVVIPFPRSLLSKLDLEVLRVRGDMNKLLVFCELYGMLNIKRLDKLTNDVYILAPEVACEALALALAPLANMLNKIEEREKALYTAMKEIDKGDKGQQITQKEEQELATKLHKSPKTIHAYLNHLEARGDFTSNGKKPKTFTLTDDITKIEEKMLKISPESLASDNLISEMLKEAQKNGYSLSLNITSQRQQIENENTKASNPKSETDNPDSVSSNPQIDEKALFNRSISKQATNSDISKENIEKEKVWFVKEIPAGSKCECGKYAATYELITPLHEQITRCEECYRNLKKQFNNAAWKQSEPELLVYEAPTMEA